MLSCFTVSQNLRARQNNDKVVLSFEVIYVTNINYILFHQTRHAAGTLNTISTRICMMGAYVKQKTLQFPQTSVFFFFI